MQNAGRLQHLIRFYSLLARLERQIGGARRLADCSGRMEWPQRGVYFFRELGENRSDTGSGPRIVRVGTHALKAGGTTTLWTRLSQHRGNDEPGPTSARGFIERNSIALLSNFGRAPLDPQSGDWLGHDSDRELVRKSGLWNQRHVEEPYDPGFLDLLDRLISK
jgi:hypothetical protein